MFVAFHCLLKSLVCVTSFKGHSKPLTCAGEALFSPCSRWRHRLRKWGSMSCPRSQMANGRAGIQTQRFRTQALLWHRSFQVPEDYREKGLEYVWGLWEGSLEKGGFELGLEEWITLWSTDPEEKKDAGGRVVTRELKTVDWGFRRADPWEERLGTRVRAKSCRTLTLGQKRLHLADIKVVQRSENSRGQDR